jgi:hypothetical protein
MEERFKCSCYTHELHLELPEEQDLNFVEITMWSCGNEEGSGWRFRLKLLWQVLTKGHCYKDMVCLDPAEAKRMGAVMFQMGDVASFRQKAMQEQVTSSSADASLPASDVVPQPLAVPQPESTEYKKPPVRWWEKLLALLPQR